MYWLHVHLRSSEWQFSSLIRCFGSILLQRHTAKLESGGNIQVDKNRLQNVYVYVNSHLSFRSVRRTSDGELVNAAGRILHLVSNEHLEEDKTQAEMTHLTGCGYAVTSHCGCCVQMNSSFIPFLFESRSPTHALPNHAHCTGAQQRTHTHSSSGIQSSRRKNDTTHAF